MRRNSGHQQRRIRSNRLQHHQRVSVLLRLYTLMSEATLGDQSGPGWVRLVCDDAGRWRAWITAAGRGEPESLEKSV